MLALLVVGGCDRLFAVLEVAQLQDAALATQDSQDVDAPTDAPADAPPVDAMTDAAPIKDAMADARPIDAPGPVCPSAYGNARGASTYLHVATSTTWTAAQAVCLSHQISGSTKYTHLAVISDDPERSYLYATVIGSDAVSHWLGYSDRVTETTYRWVTDETGYPAAGDFPWGSGQPSPSVGDNCVLMSNVIDFVSTNCMLQPYHYVCECDDHPNNAANY
jgi:hypothetical protein